jgi:hypothetical protein
MGQTLTLSGNLPFLNSISKDNALSDLSAYQVVFRGIGSHGQAFQSASAIFVDLVDRVDGFQLMSHQS